MVERYFRGFILKLADPRTALVEVTLRDDGYRKFLLGVGERIAADCGSSFVLRQSGIATERKGDCQSATCEVSLDHSRDDIRKPALRLVKKGRPRFSMDAARMNAYSAGKRKVERRVA